MSAPSDQLDRSPSRQQSSAIRVVPYSPPRARNSSEAARPQEESHDFSSTTDDNNNSNNDGRADPTVGKTTTASSENRRYYPPVTRSERPPPQLAKRRDDAVSEWRSATFQGTSFAEPRYGTAAPAVTPTVVPVSPSSNVLPGPSVPGSGRRPSSRRSKFVAVLNEDKTFSLVPQRPRESDPKPSQSYYPPRSSSGLSEYAGLGLRSSQLHSFPTTPRVSQASSHEGVSSYASSHYDRPSSSLAETIPDRSLTPATPVPSSPGSSYQETITEHPAVVEPSLNTPSWIGRMVGGLRRFQPHQDSIGSLESAQSSTSDNPNYRVYGPSSPVLSPVPESPAPAEDTRELRPANSFLSGTSSLAESANYVVYGQNSSALSSVESFNPPSESGSFAPLLGSPSAAAGPSGIVTAAEPNYVVLGEPTPEPSREASPNSAESGGTVVRRPREEYSQESLVVSPLRPRRASLEGFGYFTARSRTKSKEDLRTKKPLKSTKSSISSIINEEASEDFLATQAYLDAPAGEQLDEQRERERQQREAAEWDSPVVAPDSEGPMALPTTPHQWSSQLSTVQSESEPDSSSGTRNSFGSISVPGSHGSHDRRSSRGWSSHSRQMLSISSSLAAELEAASRSRSNSNSQPGSLEKPSPSYRPPYRGMIRDHDEDGDGLGELHQISPRPSRSRLSELFAHGNHSERNLHSSASMRSFSNTIPLWAKVYYGSGERKFLRSTSISSMSDLSSRPGSMLHHSASPLSEDYPQGIYSPRRRPKEYGQDGRRTSRVGSMEIGADSTNDEFGFRRSIRRMTSSLWSPPPAARCPRALHDLGHALGGLVVLFVFGFIFPFAWMIGAVLPLPKPSPLAMVQRDSSYSDLAVRTRSHEFDRHIESVDELRYENAKWWRMLNRCMSFVGLLIIGAVVGLAVAAVKEGWTSGS
ncbi:hypothetical protein M406DRAFT_96647 [Cryphonectria parasitica EP155]|uniref:Serine-rich protein n=1 Tax=Cryphonectria parasitica (strain ATCC 38755 / EP155) TaxID=660469 RepID=A0A9P4YBJ7_CRYP1|nr:uncharacterized protein M406DRAFT_96647 [Cryphonectria parasitica EP155]KAF3770036.1 hypothetical protein M406DRAFT_96647 [Cryphonectria parasitica EP155]